MWLKRFYSKTTGSEAWNERFTTTQTTSNRVGNEKGLLKLATTFFIDSSVKSMFEQVKKISTDTMNWVSIVAFHMATIPTLLSIVSGINDRVPTSDVALFIYLGLVVMLVRSIVQKDLISTLLNGVGFFAQVSLFALVVFK